jgi:hypothetical protein
MNAKNAIVGVTAVGLMIAGGAAIMTSGLKGGGKDGGVISGDAEPFIDPPTEAQIVDKSVRASNGKLVRISGAFVDKNAAVIDSNIGRTVVVDSPPDSSVCNVVFVANTRDGGPDVPDDVRKHLGDAADPVMIGYNIWTVLLRGEACRSAGMIPGYLGSTMQEFLGLTPEIQARFLKVEGDCSVDGKKVLCSVPVGDPRARVGAKPFFPHDWADRPDLNMGQDEASKSK